MPFDDTPAVAKTPSLAAAHDDTAAASKALANGSFDDTAPSLAGRAFDYSKGPAQLRPLEPIFQAVTEADTVITTEGDQPIETVIIPE